MNLTIGFNGKIRPMHASEDNIWPTFLDYVVVGVSICGLNTADGDGVGVVVELEVAKWRSNRGVVGGEVGGIAVSDVFEEWGSVTEGVNCGEYRKVEIGTHLDKSA